MEVLKPSYIYIITIKQVGLVVEERPSGYRIKNIGIVPYNECREATEQEINNWLNR
jgi:hypothetical protein